ncbi:MAG TPA: hypothetical protein VJ063_11715 [Verrucomicrobiae bacterium]|nr:hypothetical protein [Verrucomicrobiae bacterium]
MEIKLVDRSTPSAFAPYVTSATVPFLPLVRDQDKKWGAGWCTYPDGFEQNPDIEVMCGGENHKTPKAAGIWRQGNLLHFGFDQSPAELNETGQRLLLNSIKYISRFTEDRPIAVTPSVFGGAVAFPRAYLDRRLGESGDPSEVAAFLSNEILHQLNPRIGDGVKAWYREHRQWLHPGPDLKLEIDNEAKRLNAPIDKPELFEKAIAALRQNKPEGKALLARYAVEETASLGSADAWEKWFKDNKAYLFFSDQGDYRWYVDPLAKKRKVPTAELRGPARASTP